MNSSGLHIRAMSALTPVWAGINTALLSGTSVPEEEWFDATVYLGRKGHRYLSKATKYALAAACNMDGLIDGGLRSGLYLGTASADTEHRRQILQGLEDGEKMLPGPACAPSASVNGPAGALARTFGINGPVMTLTGGDDSGLICLWQAAMGMSRGATDTCIVGQVEHIQNAPDGAVLWSLTRECEDNSLAEIHFDGFSRLRGNIADKLTSEILRVNSHVTLIAAETPDIEDFIKSIKLSNPFFQYMPADTLHSMLCPDMHLFSLLSLAILNGTEGCILILSRYGHLFKLTCKSKRITNA